MRKALLLGAGFSIPLGMPSSAEFSKSFFTYLTPEKLKSIAAKCKEYEPYGEANPTDKQTYDTVVDDFVSLYDHGNANYETVIKTLEEKHHLNSAAQLAQDHLVGKFRVLLNESFLIFQNKTNQIYEKNRDIIGRFLEKYAENGLLVFSLNHDLSIEMLCNDYEIDLSLGGVDMVRFPYSNIDHDRLTTFHRRDNKERKIENLNITYDAKGVNLLKLHGGINEFFFDDDKWRISMLPKHNQSAIEYLKELSEFCREPHYFVDGRHMPVEGEIVIGDEFGEIQFLRPTIVSGGRKFSATFDPNQEQPIMSLFSSGLAQVDELCIIGYSFSDEHINNRLIRAMHLNDNLKLEIIDPSNAKQKMLSGFDYGLRLRTSQCDTLTMLDYYATGKWDSSIKTRNAETMKMRNNLYYDMNYNIFHRP